MRHGPWLLPDWESCWDAAAAVAAAVPRIYSTGQYDSCSSSCRFPSDQNCSCSIFPGSQVIKLVCFPRFPGLQVIKSCGFPVFPSSQVINSCGFPRCPGSEVSNVPAASIFEVSNLPIGPTAPPLRPLALWPRDTGKPAGFEVPIFL